MAVRDMFVFIYIYIIYRISISFSYHVLRHMSVQNTSDFSSVVHSESRKPASFLLNTIYI